MLASIFSMAPERDDAQVALALQWGLPEGRR